MQKRAIIMLLVALIMGGIAVSLVNTAIDRKESTGDISQLAVTSVVVAAANLEVGTRLSGVMLKTADWPKANTPDGYYTTIEAIMGDEAPVVVREIKKGEVVLPYKISGHGARAGLTPKIPSEMRAMTISVNEVRGVAGFVLPGDHVDVLYTYSPEGKKNQFTTKPILQNIQVLGVDQSASEKEDKPQVVNAVTLLVSSQQGKILTLAQRAGELTLLLRNEGDATISEDGSVSLSDIETKKRKASSSKRADGNYYVKVIRGLKPTMDSTQLAAPTGKE